MTDSVDARVSISTSVANSAARYARQALSQYVAAEYEDFYLFAGIAVEKAMKARLATENPSYLAPDKQFRAQMLFWRHREDVVSLPMGTMTIGGREALDRVMVMFPTFSSQKPGVTELLRYRNGEAHFGLIDISGHRASFVSFLRAINALLRIDQDRFWDPHAQLVRVTLDESAQELARQVRMRISKAIERFGLKFDSLLEDQRVTLLALIDANVQDELSNEVLALTCPACNHQGLVEGTNEVDTGEPDFDNEGNAVGIDSWLDFTASNFKCPFCGLELEGVEELELAELPITWTNEDADMSEYWEQESRDWGTYI